MTILRLKNVRAIDREVECVEDAREVDRRYVAARDSDGSFAVTRTSRYGQRPQIIDPATVVVIEHTGLECFDA